MDSYLLGKYFMVQKPYSEWFNNKKYNLNFDLYYKIIAFDGCCYVAHLIDYEREIISGTKEEDDNEAKIVETHGIYENLDDGFQVKNWDPPIIKVFTPQELNNVCIYETIKDKKDDIGENLYFLDEYKFPGGV